MANKLQENRHHDAPSVLAYRVGQLEKTVSTGFTKLEMKLELMQESFVKKEDLAVLEKQATNEHEDIREDLERVRKEVHEIKDWKDGLIGKIAAGAVIMLVLMVLAMYGLDQFVK